MRFKLTLTVKISDCGNLLPCNYQYELSSLLYGVLSDGDSEFTAWLHDHGFLVSERKQFKLFTFSNFYIPRFQIFEDRLSVLSDHVELIVSFYPVEAIEAFVMGVFRNRRMVLGDRKSRVAFEVASVEKLPEPEFSPVMQFKTLSPIFIEQQYPESRRTIHISPADSVFAGLLHSNLVDKYKAFYNPEFLPDWPELQVRLLSEPKPKTITIKAGTPQETRMKGYMCSLELSGAPELLKIGYEGGFGRLSSQGFGCVAVKNDKMLNGGD